MPVQVSYPGVYIQEVSSGVHTITGVSTSIAAFFGRASKGPMNRAIRILSLSDFTRVFGDPFPGSDLASSVRLFFSNGGTDCYVVRVAHGATKASITLRSLAGQTALKATAKAEGDWANTVRLEVDYNTPTPDDTFNLRVIQEDKGVAVVTESFSNLTMNPAASRYAPAFVSQSSDLIDLSAVAPVANDLSDPTKSFAGFSLGRRPLGPDDAGVKATVETGMIKAAAPNNKSQFDISVNDGPFVTVNLLPWTDKATAADIATQIKDKINTALGSLSPAPTVDVAITKVGGTATIGNLLKITSASGDKSSVRVRSATTNDIAGALMLGLDQGGIEATRWGFFRPAPNATTLAFDDPVGTPGTLGWLDLIAELKQGGLTEIVIDGTPVPLALVTMGNNSNTPWYTGANGGTDGVREKLRMIAAAVNAKAGLPWRAEVWGYHLALIAKSGTINQQATIAMTPTDAETNKLKTALVGNVRQYTLGNGGLGSYSTAGTPGTNGTTPLTAADYQGIQVNQTGIYALDGVDLFNLMVIPADEALSEAEHMTLWGAASIYCAQHRAFLVIDAPASWTVKGRPKVVEDTTKVDDIRKLVVKTNSAVFYPRLIVSEAGLNRYVGPGGAIAGLMARIDSSRGVWKAPAGTEADIRAIVGLEVKLTDPENGVLNKIAANCLRSFPVGIVNWGARTMEGSDDIGSEWKYIPIRRLALFLEESLYRGTKWIVFEPNDEPLWAKIRLNINAFMMSLFRQGAFQGSTPDKAFFVKCDGETTTQNDRNLGIVNIEIGFAPLKPAEFVILKIQQIAGQL